jgi:hypothetical protein
MSEATRATHGHRECVIVGSDELRHERDVYGDLLGAAIQALSQLSYSPAVGEV